MIKEIKITLLGAPDWLASTTAQLQDDNRTTENNHSNDCTEFCEQGDENHDEPQ
jgi:hypothetical protein